MVEPAAGIRGSNGTQRLHDGVLKRLPGSGFGGAQGGLELRPAALNRRQIGRIRGQVLPAVHPAVQWPRGCPRPCAPAGPHGRSHELFSSADRGDRGRFYFQSIPATYTKDSGRSKVIMPYTQRAGLTVCPFLSFSNHLPYALLSPTVRIIGCINPDGEGVEPGLRQFRSHYFLNKQ